MYINPNSTIKILRNVPLDNTYEHTIYFASHSAQSSYFSGLAKYTFEAQSYQRVKRGYIRVATNAENLYDCNYLMFQNSAFGSKWFYAFIKSVEYINNGVSEIEFEIDVMQTWHFDYTIKACFVEREHSATDVIGDNIVEENLALGEYVESNNILAGVTDKLSYYIDGTITKDYNDYLGGSYTMMDKPMLNGFYTFTATHNELMYWLLGRGIAGDITNTSTIEENRVKVKNGVYNIRLAPTTQKSYVTYGFNNSIGSYIPRNNKLLTYPYNFCYVNNFQGNTAVYKYEYFTNNSANFYLATDSTAGSPAVLYPANYKGLAENKDEQLTLKDFPTCGWISSYYDYWLANSTTTRLPTMITNIATGAVSGAMVGSGAGAIAGAGLGALSSVVGFMSEKRWAEMQPPQAHGTQSGAISYWNDTLDFGIFSKHITPDIARTIDDYFDRFGYATHRLKVPNRNVRPQWCYTKTVGCTIVGSVPADDMKKICSIYDKGVTFWKNGANVGNYSLNNRV